MWTMENQAKGFCYIKLTYLHLIDKLIDPLLDKSDIKNDTRSKIARPYLGFKCCNFY